MEGPLEIYVHIPFCARKCNYCDFYSFPADEKTRETFFASLKEEILSSPWTGRSVSSVFFGGGTPSIVKPEQIRDVLETVRDAFRILPDAEITLEANPGTVTKESLRAYKDMGIGRLSMGLQSANARTLRKLGRIHDLETFVSSFELARAAGFRNISVDLMSGLPGETLQDFENSLFQTLSLRPEHISVYSLIVEENTPFYALYGEGCGTHRSELPDEDADREMTAAAVRILSGAGYVRYEISNYARPGFESKHNTGYWTGVPYLGFGPSAASYIGGKRFKNPLSLNWCGLPYVECETLSKEDRMSEFMILGLRMTRGVSEADFAERFGEPLDGRYGAVIDKYVRLGALSRSGGRLFLTPYGLDVSNVILAEFL
ncbi:MAG: radical SAM family heme chaperone HemW [Lachnospiraceae bacterium]|nr:radical SAM family heme chaperone HemW [Lachnospiraceae bacterium]